MLFLHVCACAVVYFTCFLVHACLAGCQLDACVRAWLTLSAVNGSVHVWALSLQVDGSRLDAAVLDITLPGAPFVVYAHSQATAFLPSSLVGLDASLYDGHRLSAPEGLVEAVEEAWR